MPTLFHDLLDDAAMFPPAERSPADALTRHHRIRSGPGREHVGPLLVAAARWEEFSAVQQRQGAAVDVVLVGSDQPPLQVPAGVQVRGLEVTTGVAEIPEVAHRIALEPADPAIVEGLLAEIGEARIDGRPVLAKFRTGGTTSDAFPSEEMLAYWILASFNAGVPFKLTAGLHHALRHTDAATGFEHHGFLNVMLAVSRALEGGAEDAVTAALAERDAATVLDQVRRWDHDDVVAVRSVFLSFGCCAVDEPLDDGRTLGLLTADAA